MLSVVVEGGSESSLPSWARWGAGGGVERISTLGVREHETPSLPSSQAGRPAGRSWVSRCGYRRVLRGRTLSTQQR